MTDGMLTHNKHGRTLRTLGAICVCLALVATSCYAIFGPLQVGTALAIGGENRDAIDSSAAGGKATNVSASDQPTDARMAQLERTLQNIRRTVVDSEARSYENKMMARELIGYIKIMVVVLIVIAVGFPFMIWLLSRRRILGLSGLSSEVAATLVVIEERQAKLANILKDIQGEIDYIHTLSVPDLKNLIQQAEGYLKQTENDLERAGVSTKKPDAGQ